MSDKTFTIKYGYGNSDRTKEYPLSYCIEITSLLYRLYNIFLKDLY